MVSKVSYRKTANSRNIISFSRYCKALPCRPLSIGGVPTIADYGAVTGLPGWPILLAFADDTRDISTEEDLELFHEDLDKLYCWDDYNNMTFNGTKFELLRYGHNENLKTVTNYLTPQHKPMI